MEFCDDQEFMPREYQIKNGKVANQAFSNNCDYAFADVCCILVHFALFGMQFSFQPKKARGCRLLSSGVTRRLHTGSGCIPAVSFSGCTFPTFPLLFIRLSTFWAFYKKERPKVKVKSKSESQAAAAKAQAQTDRQKEPSPKSDPPPRSVPCPVGSDSDAADSAPEPREAKDAAVVHSDGSEEDSDTPRQPPAKKTKKEKTKERGRKEAASVYFKIEAPRGGSHRISAAPTRAERYKESRRAMPI